MNKIALVTGATSGIGRATAIKLADNNYNLIITGRRSNLLDDLVSELENIHSAQVYSLCFDIRNNDEVVSSIEQLPEEWKQIDVLVNNAGLASGLSKIQDGLIDDWEKMIDTNVKGLLYISRLIAPIMVKRNTGHIINVGSIAGKEVYSNGNVYCSTKHAVESLTKAMRMDMVEHGIKVTGISPGMVETEFSIVRFHGDKQKAKSVYENLEPLRADDVAETVLFALTRPPHVI